MCKNVLLYGNSILLSGLAAQMQTQPELVVRCRPAQAGLTPLSGIDAVIIDVNEISLAHMLAILQAHTDVRIIGLDDRSGTATVLSRQLFQILTLDDVGNYL
jgi:hypothetical protein